MSTAISNVVPFRRPAARPAPCDVVTVADDLLAAIDALRELAGRAAGMARPATEVERTVQNLLDALSSLERAADGLGEGGSEAAPG